MSLIELEILASFFPNVSKIRTASGIEKKTSYSHERVYTTLKKLEKNGKIIRQEVGRTNVYRLNLSNDLFLPYVYFNDQIKNEILKDPSLQGKFNKTIYAKNGCTLFLRHEKKLINISTQSDLKKMASSQEFLENVVIINGLEFFFRTMYSEVNQNDIQL